MMWLVAAILVIAGVLTPLIRRDLTRATRRRRYGRVYVRLEFDATNFLAAMEQASRALDRFGSEMRNAVGPIGYGPRPKKPRT